MNSFGATLLLLILHLVRCVCGDTIKIGLLGSYTNSSVRFAEVPEYSIDADLHFGIQAALDQSASAGRLPPGDFIELVVRNIHPPQTLTSGSADTATAQVADLIDNEDVLATAGVYTHGSVAALNAGSSTNATQPATPTIGSISPDPEGFYSHLHAISYRMSFTDENIALLNIAINSKLRCQKFAVVYDATSEGITEAKDAFLELLEERDLTSVVSYPALGTTTPADIGSDVMGGGAGEPAGGTPTCVMDFTSNGTFNLELAEAVVTHHNFGQDTYIIAPSIANLPEFFFPPSLRGFLFFVQQLPHPEDTSWLAVEKFQEAVATLEAKGGFYPNLTSPANVFTPSRNISSSYFALEGYMVGRLLVEIFARMQKPYTRQGILDSVYSTSVFLIDDVNVGQYIKKCVGKRVSATTTDEDVHSHGRRSVVSADTTDSCTCTSGNKLLFTSYLNATGSIAAYTADVSENQMLDGLEKSLDSCTFSTAQVLNPSLFLIPVDTAYASAWFSALASTAVPTAGERRQTSGANGLSSSSDHDDHDHDDEEDDHQEYSSSSADFDVFLAEIEEYSTFLSTILQHISGNHEDHESQLRETGDLVPLLRFGENLTTTTSSSSTSASLEELYQRYKVTAVVAGFHNFSGSPRSDIVMLDHNKGGTYALEDPHVTAFERNRIHTDAVLADYVMAVVRHFVLALVPSRSSGYSRITVIAETEAELTLLRKSLWTFQLSVFDEVVIPNLVAGGTTLGTWLDGRLGGSKTTSSEPSEVVFLASQRADTVNQSVFFAAAHSDLVQLHVASSEEVLDGALSDMDAASLAAWSHSNIFFASTYEAFWTSSDAPTHQSISSNFYSTLAEEGLGGATWTKLRAFRMAAILFIAQDAIISTVTSQEFVDVWYTQGTLSAYGETLGFFYDTPCSEAENKSNTPDRACQCNKGPRYFYLHSARDWALKVAASNLSVTYSYKMSTCGVVYTDLVSVGFFMENNALTVGLGVGLTGACLLTLALVLFVISTKSGKRDVTAAPKDPTKSFSIVFTDIQSSTSLWARIPDKMGEAVDTHHEIIRKLIKEHRGYEVKTIGDSFMVAFQDTKDAVEFAVDVQHDLFDNDWGHCAIDDVYDQLAEEMPLPEEHGLTSFNDCNQCSSATSKEQRYRAAIANVWNGLRVRIGIHHGSGDIKLDQVTQGYDYYGTVVNTAARVEGVGNGGQVLITGAAFQDLLLSMGVSPPAINGKDASTLVLGLTKVTVLDLGPQPLRGLDEPVVLHQVLPAGLGKREFAALRLDVEREADTTEESSASGSRRSVSGNGVGDTSHITPELLAERYSRRVQGDHGYTGTYHQLLSNFQFAKVLLSTSGEKKRNEIIEHWATKWRLPFKNSHDKKLPSALQWDRHLMNIVIKVTPAVEVSRVQHKNHYLETSQRGGRANLFDSARFSSSNRSPPRPLSLSGRHENDLNSPPLVAPSPPTQVWS